MVKRIAVASEGSGGLEDKVATTYGKCRTFTVIDVEDRSIRSVKVEANPYVSRSMGVGPLVSEMLRDLEVDSAIAGEFGPGALSVLRELRIKAFVKPAGTRIEDAVKEYVHNTQIPS